MHCPVPSIIPALKYRFIKCRIGAGFMLDDTNTFHGTRSLHHLVHRFSFVCLCFVSSRELVRAYNDNGHKVTIVLRRRLRSLPLLTHTHTHTYTHPTTMLQKFSFLPKDTKLSSSSSSSATCLIEPNRADLRRLNIITKVSPLRRQTG